MNAAKVPILAKTAAILAIGTTKYEPCKSVFSLHDASALISAQTLVDYLNFT
jgi:hypothetical protein